MVFVPTPHTSPSVELSPRARDLARSLEKAVEEYRTRNPGLTDAEVRQALMLMDRGRASGTQARLVALLLAGMVAMGVVMFVAMSEDASSQESVKWVAIGIGFIAALMGILTALRRRGGGGP